MDNLLRDVLKTAVYIDDIIIGGKDEAGMLLSLDLVFTILERAGFRLRLTKCEFMQPQVTYLGHVISKEGLRPTSDKMAALRDAPKPANVAELRSWIGLMTFYTKFIPN
jgi:hypothetical protein